MSYGCMSTQPCSAQYCCSESISCWKVSGFLVDTRGLLVTKRARIIARARVHAHRHNIAARFFVTSLAQCDALNMALWSNSKRWMKLMIFSTRLRNRSVSVAGLLYFGLGNVAASCAASTQVNWEADLFQ